MKKIVLKPGKAVLLISVLALVLSACGTNTPVQVSGMNSDSPLPQAEIIFQVSVPNALPENNFMAIDILDEVTGLAFNPTRYQMQSIDPTSYFVRVTVPLGAVIKYRYLQISNVASLEYSSQNTPIRYRLCLVTGPAIIQDKVAGWIDTPYSGPTGAIEGQILSADNSGVPDIYVTIDGMSTFTGADGKFNISSIPAGSHNIVAYSLDGAYATFQQGAVIAEGAITPAVFQITKNNLVNVMFDVVVPDGDYANVPVRIIGSLLQLGNQFADLDGGLSTVASKGLALTKTDNGHFQVTTQLPAGAYIEFKYSLGDGFWNAERQTDGQVKIRKIIVPSSDTTFRDTVASWATKEYAPVTFNVTDTAGIPENESLYIQFNPFAWTNPIPMWKVDSTHWYYTLYSPLDLFTQLGYRYCLNDQCNDTNTYSGSSPTFTPSSTSQSFHDTIGN